MAGFLSGVGIVVYVLLALAYILAGVESDRHREAQAARAGRSDGGGQWNVRPR